MSHGPGNEHIAVQGAKTRNRDPAVAVNGFAIAEGSAGGAQSVERQAIAEAAGNLDKGKDARGRRGNDGGNVLRGIGGGERCQVVGEGRVAAVYKAPEASAREENAVDVLDVGVEIGIGGTNTVGESGNGNDAMCYGVETDVGTEDDAYIIDLEALGGENTSDLIDSLGVRGPKIGAGCVERGEFTLGLDVVGFPRHGPVADSDITVEVSIGLEAL